MLSSAVLLSSLMAMMDDLLLGEVGLDPHSFAEVPS